MPKKILVINGCNLNMLGMREPIYGTVTLKQIEERLSELAKKLGAGIEFFQSNHEGDIIDTLLAARGNYDGVIMNPGAFTHVSYPIRDAVSASGLKVVEVHLTNLHAREEFRQKCVIAPVCAGQIQGLGATGYELALMYLLKDD
jgi:3-dehydroquinate dehydratase-2